MIMRRESLVDEFIRTRLLEGGHRITINQDVKDSFIHAVCLIKDPVKRIEQVKEVFDAIRDRNIEEFERNNSKAEAEVLENEIESDAGIDI